MAVQLSVAVRNARLDVIPTTVAASAKLKILTGSVPANCAAAETGTVVAQCNLPATYFAAASAGAMAKTGTWEDTSADATGTASYWRLYESTLTTCHAQGTVTATGGGGDMEVTTVSFVAAQPFTVTAWSFTDGNA